MMMAAAAARVTRSKCLIRAPFPLLIHNGRTLSDSRPNRVRLIYNGIQPILSPGQYAPQAHLLSEMTTRQPDQQKTPAEDERREAIERGRAIAATHFPDAFAAREHWRAAWPVLLIAAVMLALAAVWYMVRPPLGGLSDAEVRDQIIKESIAAYQESGRPCACPYNTMADGRQCSDFSAYSQPGAAAPLCYPKDVSEAAIREWRSRNAR